MPRFTGDEHNLPDDNIMDAFQILCAAMHGTQSTTTHDFTPSTPSNLKWSGWTAILGIETSISVIMTMHALPRRPPSPSAWERLQTGALSNEDELSDEDDLSDSSSESESDTGSSGPSAALRVEEKPQDSPFDSLELEQMVEHWHSRTRPQELTTSARMRLGRLVRGFKIGQSTADESRALHRYFKARSVADHLADELAQEFGISDTAISCTDFREVDGLPSCNGVGFWDVYWGRLAPKADRVVDRLEHPYRKAGQWIFASWTQSKKPTTVLLEILERVGGRMSARASG
jgi:hypothetical protein